MTLIACISVPLRLGGERSTTTGDERRSSRMRLKGSTGRPEEGAERSLLNCRPEWREHPSCEAVPEGSMQRRLASPLFSAVDWRSFT